MVWTCDANDGKCYTQKYRENDQQEDTEPDA